MKALVSGTNRGFGASILRELESKGWEVVSLNRSCAEVSEECYSLDLAESENVDSVLGRLVEAHKDISVVILNAGVLGSIARTSKVSSQDMLRTLEVNFLSPKRIVDFMLSNSPATQKFLQISSGAAVKVYPHWAPYGLSKLMLLRLFDYYRVEHPKKIFLSVNPGPMSTPMNVQIRNEADDDLHWKSKFLNDENLSEPSNIARSLVRLIMDDSHNSVDNLIDLRSLQLDFPEYPVLN